MRRNILAVNIRENITSAIKERLQIPDMQIVNLFSVKKAVDFLKGHATSLILLNNLLPPLESYREFCILVRSQSNTANIPIIVFAEKKEEVNAKLEVFRSGLVNDYIESDSLIEEIIVRINVLIELRLLHEELEHKNILLQKISITDELTQLHNRRYLLERLNEELGRIRRYNYTFACLLIDLDHFKKINDSFGHQIGDEVLKAVAQLIKKNVRAVDIVGRYGGEEFLLVLPHTNLEQAAVVAERLRQLVMSSPFSLANLTKPLSLTLSFGVVSVSASDQANIDRIIEIADEQLYSAKKGGRNLVCARAYSEGDK